jgi:hypothetical protein
MGVQGDETGSEQLLHKPKGDTEKALEDADLRDKIEAICLEFRRYG